MSERRKLIEGLHTRKPEDIRKEEEFVFKGKPPVSTVSPPNRIPLTTRLRADMFEALKRESLERQLQKVEPNTIQELLEEALEPWLKAKGYL